MVTLFIPTRNRPEFLRRTLEYYARERFFGWLFIGDASTGEAAERNQATVKAFAHTLRILYRSCPGLSACAANEALIPSITTPYCAYLGDDDFLSVQGLEQCVAFLEGHPEYGAAHGMCVMFQTEHNRPYGPIGNVGYYPQAVVGAETGVGRLKEFFTDSQYTLLYSVHRAAVWQAMFRGLRALPGMQNSNVFKDELIAVGVSVIRGKVKQLNVLSLVHQVHEDSYRFPHVYDWLTDPAWFPSYQVFHGRLVEELVRQDGASIEEARAVIRDIFWPYLAAQVIKAWKTGATAGVAPGGSTLRRIARRLPGRAAARRSRSPAASWRTQSRRKRRRPRGAAPRPRTPRR